jgi:hypothetical protein
MALGDIKLFQLTQGGVSADVYLEELAGGQTQIKITATHGVIDLNAIFWDFDGGDNSLAGAGIPNSLNMNGVGTPAGTQWDDAMMLSAAGSHDLQLSAGQSYTVGSLVNVSVEDFMAFGIRAGGNKMVDTSGVFTPAPPPPPHLGDELVQNWDFEKQSGDIADGGFLQTANVTDWQNLAGSLELTSTNYTGNANTGPMAGSSEKVWLDASASPGDIHLQTVADLSDGSSGQLTVSVANQDILYNGQHYTADGDDHLIIKYDGLTVLDIDKSQFADTNTFHDFTVNVAGTANAELLEVLSTGNTDNVDGNGEHHGYASFAVDHISLKEWLP